MHHAIFFEGCAECDITPVRYGILTTLWLHPGADQNSIAGDTGIDRMNVADVPARLERRGLVRRQRGVAERRTFITRLTPEGEHLTKALLGSMRRAQERLLAPLDAVDRESSMAMMLWVIDPNNDFSRAALGPTRIDRAA